MIESRCVLSYTVCASLCNFFWVKSKKFASNFKSQIMFISCLALKIKHEDEKNKDF